MTIRVWNDPEADRRRFTAHNVQPEQAFSGELLRAADGEHLIFDPDAGTITVEVDNGKWVWKITHTDPATDVVYGRWPD